MGNKEIISSLLEWSDFLSEKSIIKDAGRSIVFWICHLCASIIDSVMAGISSVLNLLNAINEPVFNAFVKRFNPYIWGLLIIALIILGIRLMIKKQEKPANVLLTICLVVFCTSMLPQFTSFISKITLDSAKDIQGSYSKVEKGVTKSSNRSDKKGNVYENEFSVKEKSLGYTVMQKHIVDMLKVDNLATGGKLPNKKNFNFSKTKPFSNAQQVAYFDINEKIDYRNDNDIKNKDIFKNKLRPTTNIDRAGAEGATEKLTNMEGHFDITSDYYYRYSVSWIVLLLVLISIAATLIFSIFRLIRIIYEVLAHQVLLPFIAVTDIESGQRTKQALKSLIVTFASIILVLLFLGVYFLLVFNIGEKYYQGKINTIIYIIMLFALCVATIDGTKLVERLLGVDIGIKSGYHTFMSMMAGTMIGGRVLKIGATGVYHGSKWLLGKYKNHKNNKAQDSGNGQESQNNRPNNNSNINENNKNKEMSKNGTGDNKNNRTNQEKNINRQSQNKTLGE